VAGKSIRQGGMKETLAHANGIVKNINMKMCMHTHTHTQATVSKDCFQTYSSTLKENKYVTTYSKCNQDLVLNMSEWVCSVEASSGLSAPYLCLSLQ
jgi:hypothetical protein